MSKLVFKASEVRRVVEHAITTEGQILLVHDQGIYLMSNGEPRDVVNETSNYVVYAVGCNPETDTNWYDTARDLVGGDDFGETLPFAPAIKEQIESGTEEITLIVTKDAIKLGKTKVSAIRKCSKCGRLLKNQDDDICQKCKDEQSSEQPSLIQAPTIFEDINTDNSVIVTPIFEEPPKLEDEQTKTDEQPQPEPKTDDVKIKPGQAIRDRFMELVSEGKITEEYIFELSTKEGTAQFFGVRYPFLKEYNPELGIKEQSYINGHSRYTSKSITIGDRQYLITNDLYKSTLPKFMDWADKLGK